MSLLVQDLYELENANLIRLVEHQPESEYVFRHALMQETAYASLLRSERAELHRIVGNALETLFPDGRDEMAAVLAHHFEEAGEIAKAVVYFTKAGERAREHYANQEASDYLGRALVLAEEAGEESRLPGLHRTRGQVFEILGDFERAREEHESALAVAQELEQNHAVWQAYIDLGMLWSSKDYERTQAYYDQALELARSMGEPSILAHTLNRIGNLEVNVSLPLVSEARHQEALQIFKSLGDEKGIAETLDYLGMTYLLAGKAAEGEECNREAARLFLKQGDELHLASTLAVAALRGANLQTMHLAGEEESYRVGLQDAKQAAQMSDNIGWRSGSAFARFTLAAAYGIGGDFDPALMAANEAVRIAEDIGHEQWALAGKCMLGAILLEMLDPEEAIAPLKAAAELADRSNSQHWCNTVTGFLANAWVELRELDLAESLLESAWQPADGPRSLSEGKMWLAKVRLSLSRGEVEDGLILIQAMYDSVPGYQPGHPIPRLGWLQGICFSRLGLLPQAEEILIESLKVSQKQEAESITWRLQAALAAVRRHMDRLDDAQDAQQAAEDTIDRMASTIGDPKLEHVFRRRAAKRITLEIPR
jgi:tetratricopeptide (TPR) repeat protein